MATSGEATWALGVEISPCMLVAARHHGATNCSASPGQVEATKTMALPAVPEASSSLVAASRISIDTLTSYLGLKPHTPAVTHVRATQALALVRTHATLVVAKLSLITRHMRGPRNIIGSRMSAPRKLLRKPFTFPKSVEKKGTLGMPTRPPVDTRKALALGERRAHLEFENGTLMEW